MGGQLTTYQRVGGQIPLPAPPTYLWASARTYSGRPYGRLSIHLVTESEHRGQAVSFATRDIPGGRRRPSTTGWARELPLQVGERPNEFVRHLSGHTGTWISDPLLFGPGGLVEAPGAPGLYCH